MPTPSYITDIRRTYGHGLLLLPGVSAVVVRDDRAEVDIQVELAAHAQDHVPFDDAARRARIADRPEQDGVERPQTVDVLWRDATGRSYITRRRPAQFLAHRGKAEALLGRIEHAERRAGDLGANTVAADYGESERGAHGMPAILAEPLT